MYHPINVYFTIDSEQIIPSLHMFTKKVAIMHTLELAPYPSNESGLARFEFQSHGGWPLHQVFVT